jgi:hypothetical protein
MCNASDKHGNGQADHQQHHGSHAFRKDGRAGHRPLPLLTGITSAACARSISAIVPATARQVAKIRNTVASDFIPASNIR